MEDNDSIDVFQQQTGGSVLWELWAEKETLKDSSETDERVFGDNFKHMLWVLIIRPWWGDSNECPQHKFLWRIWKIILQ